MAATKHTTRNKGKKQTKRRFLVPGKIKKLYQDECAKRGDTLQPIAPQRLAA